MVYLHPFGFGFVVAFRVWLIECCVMWMFVWDGFVYLVIVWCDFILNCFGV